MVDAAEVDDLLQEVLIKAHEKLHTVKDDTSIKAWLFQVANNTIIDFYRKRAKSRNVEASDLWYESNDQSDWEDLARCIAPFVQALPDETAKLLAAIDLEGKSQKEYAAMLGISYTTLKSRVQKGRSELRHVFDRCCEFELDQSGRLANYKPRSGTCDDC